MTHLDDNRHPDRPSFRPHPSFVPPLSTVVHPPCLFFRMVIHCGHLCTSPLPKGFERKLAISGIWTGQLDRTLCRVSERDVIKWRDVTSSNPKLRATKGFVPNLTPYIGGTKFISVYSSIESFVWRPAHFEIRNLTQCATKLRSRLPKKIHLPRNF